MIVLIGRLDVVKVDNDDDEEEKDVSSSLTEIFSDLGIDKGEEACVSDTLFFFAFDNLFCCKMNPENNNENKNKNY